MKGAFDRIEIESIETVIIMRMIVHCVCPRPMFGRDRTVALCRDTPELP